MAIREKEDWVVSCRDVHLTFHVPEERQKVKDVFMTGGRSLRTRTFEVLRGINFELGPSEILGVIGRNGAGKSTLLRLLGGIFRPDRGQIEVKGRIGMMMELGAGFHPDLTGRENVFLNASLLGVDTNLVRERFDAIVEWCGLHEFIDMEVRHYSSGMRARLGFAVAVELRPDVLLIDEVLAVGDADFRRRCDEKFQEFVDGGTTIVLVTHTLSLVEERCSKVLWIDGGEVREFGDPTHVLSQYQAAISRERGVSLGAEQKKREEAANKAKAEAEAKAKAKAEAEAKAKAEAEAEAEAKAKAEAKAEAKAKPVPEEKPEEKPVVLELWHPSDDQPPQMPGLPSEPRRWGDGGLVIDEVIIRLKNGERSYIFGLSEHIRYDIHYHLEEALERVHFGILLRTPDGNRATGANTMTHGNKVLEPFQRGVCTIEMPTPSLNRGKYIVTVYAFHVNGRDRVDLDVWENMAAIEVTGGVEWNLGLCWMPNVLFHNNQAPDKDGA